MWSVCSMSFYLFTFVSTSKLVLSPFIHIHPGWSFAGTKVVQWRHQGRFCMEAIDSERLHSSRHGQGFQHGGPPKVPFEWKIEDQAAGRFVGSQSKVQRSRKWCRTLWRRSRKVDTGSWIKIHEGKSSTDWRTAPRLFMLHIRKDCTQLHLLIYICLYQDHVQTSCFEQATQQCYADFSRFLVFISTVAVCNASLFALGGCTGGSHCPRCKWNWGPCSTCSTYSTNCMTFFCSLLVESQAFTKEASAEKVRCQDFPGACTISTGGQHLCALQQASGLVVCCWDADGDNTHQDEVWLNPHRCTFKMQLIWTSKFWAPILLHVYATTEDIFTDKEQ